MFANPLILKQHYALLPKVKLLSEKWIMKYMVWHLKKLMKIFVHCCLVSSISFTAVPISEDSKESMKNQKD